MLGVKVKGMPSPSLLALHSQCTWEALLAFVEVLFLVFTCNLLVATCSSYSIGSCWYTVVVYFGPQVCKNSIVVFMRVRVRELFGYKLVKLLCFFKLVLDTNL